MTVAPGSQAMVHVQPSTGAEHHQEACRGQVSWPGVSRFLGGTRPQKDSELADDERQVPARKPGKAGMEGLDQPNRQLHRGGQGGEDGKRRHNATSLWGPGWHGDLYWI
jgi:hypothetical protein